MKNHSPDQKSRSTKKECYRNDTVDFKLNFTEFDTQPQLNLGEPGLAGEESSKPGHRKQSIKTNEIQIEENTLEDEEEKGTRRFTPKLMTEEIGSPEERQYFTEGNQPSDKQMFQIALKNMYKGENEGSD